MNIISESLKMYSALEYNADITINNFRKGLFDNLMKDKSAGVLSLEARLIFDKTTTDQYDKNNPEHAKWFKSRQDDILKKLMGYLEYSDHTSSKSYVPFLAKNYAKGGWNAKLEDIRSKIEPMLDKYDLLKRKNKLHSDHKDIMKFKDFEDFYTAIAEYEEPIDEVVNKGTSELVYEDNEVRVIVPHDQDAACYYGQGTKWCTAATKGGNMFEDYNSRGDLYILLPKHPEYDGEKYQLHFETSSYMDETDKDVSIYELIYKRFGPGLKNYLSGVDPNLKVSIQFVSNKILSDITSTIRDIVTDTIVSDQIQSIAQEDDSYYKWLLDEYGYPPNSDLEGQVDWDKVSDEDRDYLNYNYDLNDYFKILYSELSVEPSELRSLTVKYIDDQVYHTEDTLSLIPEVLAYKLLESGKFRGYNLVADVIKFIKINIDVTYKLVDNNELTYNVEVIN